MAAGWSDVPGIDNVGKDLEDRVDNGVYNLKVRPEHINRVYPELRIVSRSVRKPFRSGL